MNECPQRLLTAETEALYTTYYEMFAPKLEDGKINKLYNELGNRYILAVFDMIFWKDGTSKILELLISN